MRKTIGSFEAKTKLSSLLDQVSKGETITITKRGRPVALLTPIPAEEFVSLDDTVRAFKDLRKNLKLSPLSIHDLISKGRK